MSGATIVWFRQDLRLRDNPALHAAAARGEPVLPVYIWSPDEEGDWPPGNASRWWLHHSLIALDTSLRQRGSRLLVAQGSALEVLSNLAVESGATAVYWNRRYEPAAARCSGAVRTGLRRIGIDTAEFNSALLVEPDTFRNQSGRPYLVYTPFMRALLHDLSPPAPLRIPRSLRAPAAWPPSIGVESLGLHPRINWYATMRDAWHPGEDGAQARLRQFAGHALAGYSGARDSPAVRGTSALSPHLHFGEIGPRQIWHAIAHAREPRLATERNGGASGSVIPPRSRRGASGRAAAFVRELVWREFAYHLLHHYPHTSGEPLRPEFAHFPWRDSPRLLRSWQHGTTGVPLVDAGMRELWATGWMHNRVRMVVASFLVKNLLIPWPRGARWFWDTLVDADLANNTLNWQWVAGCGADAAPYFRIFNPLSQARRFDPGGCYVRKWVPEAAHPVTQSMASYPEPVIDLKQSRERALEAYESMRRVSRSKLGKKRGALCRRR